MAKQTKFIFVTGGVLSGVGKGITAASIGNILKARGLNVNIQKCDPYLNVDAGTLNPARHGETFVTKDGAETDLDLGHYERFMDIELTSSSSLMSGRVLKQVIEDERAGKYLGRDVQLVPHVTEAIQDKIKEAGAGFDVHIVEIGGTVGDIEGLSFIEAIREFAQKVGRENCLYVHVVYLPYLGTSNEIKTKPAQNAVKDLRGYGIMPDVLVARSEVPAPESALEKLASFTVGRDSIVSLPNAETVYQVPLTLEESGIGNVIVSKLGIKASKPKLDSWKKLVKSALTEHKTTVTVGIVAKYMDNEDTYISVFEAVAAAGLSNGVVTKIKWIDAEKLTKKNIAKSLSGVDGIIVPGGFGSRAIEGKILAATYAMDHHLPYLGLCLGMQVAVIAVARKAGLEKANSLEVDPETPHPVIYIMPGQEDKTGTGGSMRLGDFTTVLSKDSIARSMYGTDEIVERHRHRYEFNNEYKEQLEAEGLEIVGTLKNGNLVEVIEIEGHPFFVASQYHPEFKSRPNRPHPMFAGFVKELKKRAK